MTSDKDSKFEDFLLKEYDNIAQAHFNTVGTISTFFKHYLLIVSLPLPLVAFVLRAGGLSQLQIPEQYRFVVPLLMGIIALIGLLVMCYIVSLRLDAILYARTVNGVRKYFMDKSGLDFEQESRFRVLPRSVHIPPYFEWRYFIFVVSTFGVIDSAYGALGLYSCLESIPLALPLWIWSVILAAIIFAIHLGSYYGLARYREDHYLRSHIIGVDIDGVLNRHREHFCKMLGELVEKQVNPDDIDTIPIHESESLNVTEQDAHAVFNHPDYWKNMPVLEGAAETLAKLKNMFGYKIILFTHRPWPQIASFPSKKPSNPEGTDYRQIWRTECGFLWRISEGRGWMRKITKDWLRNGKIVYDKLIIEKGNTHTIDPRIKARTRFVISRRKNIRIFVEDDLLKAVKLTDICEVVFLIDHPYNRTDIPLPGNLMRVTSWDEIYKRIRRVF